MTTGARAVISMAVPTIKRLRILARRIFGLDFVKSHGGSMASIKANGRRDLINPDGSRWPRGRRLRPWQILFSQLRIYTFQVGIDEEDEEKREPEDALYNVRKTVIEVDRDNNNSDENATVQRPGNRIRA